MQHKRFEAEIFLAGPSSRWDEEMSSNWMWWLPQAAPSKIDHRSSVYIADGALESFLGWYDSLPPIAAQHLQSIVWCGDGDSLGKHRMEILKQTAARFEGRWREHFYPTDKDFSDCAALLSLIEYDVRHSVEPVTAVGLSVRGALGGRSDHEWVNIYELIQVLTRLPVAATVCLGPRRVLSTAPVILHNALGQKFTLLSAIPNQPLRVRVNGARYSGELLLRQPSHGLSNVAVSESVQIEPLSPSLPMIGILSE